MPREWPRDVYVPVPGADSTRNVGVEDVVGNKGDAAVLVPSTTASLMAYIKAILAGSDLVRAFSTTPSLTEFWIDEAGINPTRWTPTNIVGGTVVRAATAFGAAVQISTANAGDGGRLVSDQRWFTMPQRFTTASIVRRFIWEWEVNNFDETRIDNAVSMLGALTTGVADTRATNDIAGFILVADVLTALTDVTGVETTTAIPGLVFVGQKHKLRMELWQTDAGQATISFYVDETLRATHSVNLNNTMRYLHFYVLQAGIGGNAIGIGPMRAWYEDEVRP